MTSGRGEPVSAQFGRELDRRVELIAAAVAACPLVAALHGGRYGHIATYLPGRRIGGVRLTESELAVHVVARYPATVTEVADQIRAAVAERAGGLPVAVTIEDLVLPGDLSLQPSSDYEECVP